MRVHPEKSLKNGLDHGQKIFRERDSYGYLGMYQFDMEKVFSC